MFRIATFRDYQFLYHCFGLSWLVPTNRDKTTLTGEWASTAVLLITFTSGKRSFLINKADFFYVLWNDTPSVIDTSVVYCFTSSLTHFLCFLYFGAIFYLHNWHFTRSWDQICI